METQDLSNPDREKRGLEMIRSIVRTFTSATAGIAISLGLLTVPAAVPASAASTPVFYYPGNAGYQVSSTTTPPETAKAEFLVPTVTCTRATLNVTFGVLVENTSGGSSGPVILEGCAKGKATYSGYVEINGKGTLLDTSVSPNNLISVSASETPTATKATFTDVSSGYRKTMTGAGSVFRICVSRFVPGNDKEGTVLFHLRIHQRQDQRRRHRYVLRLDRFQRRSADPQWKGAAERRGRDPARGPGKVVVPTRG